MFFILLFSTFKVQAGSVVEKLTGHNYPDMSGFNSLIGVGVRIKQVGPIAAKVYSAGLYVSKFHVASKCKALKCKSPSELLAHKSFAESIFSDGQIVLKMARDVKSETMASALSDAVSPRMGGKDSDRLEKLRSMIIEALPNGCNNKAELKFSCSATNVGVTIDGKSRGQIQSSVLSSALLRTYTDAKAVSPTLRENIAKTAFSWAK